MLIKIKEYKGVEIKYETENGKLYFDFEEETRKVNYVFEAEQIIDEPQWETCNINGYFIDGYINKFIGLARATRKDKKNGEYEWYLKGEHDSDFKKVGWTSKDNKIYLKNDHNESVYKQWEEQRSKYLAELRKLNNITNELT